MADGADGGGPSCMSGRINADQAAFWASASGQSWVDHQIAMDSVLAPVLDLLLARAELSEGMDVIDIGCGTGANVLKAADITSSKGRVTGFDISPVLLALAKTRTAHLPHVRFIEGDAQTYDFTPKSADALISRFGVMFFEDTTAAFANMARALRPGGRMTMAVWGPAHQNPWFMVPAKVAKARLGEVPKTDRSQPGPFAFEDKNRTGSLLEAAGLTVEIDTVDIALNGGPDLLAAAELCTRIGPAASVLRQKEGTEDDRRAIAEGLAEVFETWMDETLAIPASIHIITASA